VAETLYPRSSLLLEGTSAGDTGLVTESLRAYRSLVTGKGYFEINTGGLALRHCQRLHINQVSGYTSGSTLTATFGSGSLYWGQSGFQSPYGSYDLTSATSGSGAISATGNIAVTGATSIYGYMSLGGGTTYCSGASAYC
jgi:hypothetical protein